jgi:hypothetical protein
MTPKLCRLVAACSLAAAAVACSGPASDVRATSSPAPGASGAVRTGLDTDVAWACGDADLQATFAASFSGDALIAAAKSAIADRSKTDATFSFVKPIESFATAFDARALCLRISGPTDAPAADALVRQLRSSGNVISVRGR